MFTRIRKSLRPATPPSPASFYSPGHSSPKFKETELPPLEYMIPPLASHHSRSDSLTHNHDDLLDENAVLVKPEIKLKLSNDSFIDSFASNMLHTKSRQRQSNSATGKSSRPRAGSSVVSPSSSVSASIDSRTQPPTSFAVPMSRERSGSTASPISQTTTPPSSSQRSPGEYPSIQTRTVNTTPVVPQMPTRRAPPPPIHLPNSHIHTSRPLERGTMSQLEIIQETPEAIGRASSSDRRAGEPSNVKVSPSSGSPQDSQRQLLSPPRAPPNPLLLHLPTEARNPVLNEQDSGSLIDVRELLASPFMREAYGSELEGDMTMQWNEFCKASGLARQDSATLPMDALQRAQSLSQKKRATTVTNSTHLERQASGMSPEAMSAESISPSQFPLPPVPPTRNSDKRMSQRSFKRLKREAALHSISEPQSLSVGSMGEFENILRVPHLRSHLRRSMSEGSIHGMMGSDLVRTSNQIMDSEVGGAAHLSAHQSQPLLSDTPPESGTVSTPSSLPIIPQFITPYPHRISTIAEIDTAWNNNHTPDTASVYSPEPPVIDNKAMATTGMSIEDLPMILSNDPHDSRGLRSNPQVPQDFRRMSASAPEIGMDEARWEAESEWALRESGHLTDTHRLSPTPSQLSKKSGSSEAVLEMVWDLNASETDGSSPFTPHSIPRMKDEVGSNDPSPSNKLFTSAGRLTKGGRPLIRNMGSDFSPIITPSSSSSSLVRSASPMFLPIGVGERRPSAPVIGERAKSGTLDERRPSLPTHSFSASNKLSVAYSNERARVDEPVHSDGANPATSLPVVKQRPKPLRSSNEVGGQDQSMTIAQVSRELSDSSGRLQRQRSGSTPNPPTPGNAHSQYVLAWEKRDRRESMFPETPKSFSPVPFASDTIQRARYQPYELVKVEFSSSFKAQPARLLLPTGSRPIPISRGASDSRHSSHTHIRVNSDASSRSVKAPTPASPKFNAIPVRWRGLTLDAAKWTLTSTQLQDIVGRAIRQSAQASSIRLLPPQILDVELPAECDQLEQLRDEIKQKYKFQVRRRRLLLRSLNLYTDGSDPTTAQRLTEELSETSIVCDQLCEELFQVTDQLDQLHHLREGHASSALAMALRKLNSSLMRQSNDNAELRSKLATLEAEREEAWNMAQTLEDELQILSSKMQTASSENSSVAQSSSKRFSRVSAARKGSMRASKASLRLSTSRRSARSSTSSFRHPTGSSSRPSSQFILSDLPPVPPMPHAPLSVVTNISRGEESILTSVSPSADTRALVKAQAELMQLLGITFQELQPPSKARPRSMSYTSPSSPSPTITSGHRIGIRARSSSGSLRQNLRRRHSLSAVTPSDDPMFKLPSPAVISP